MKSKVLKNAFWIISCRVVQSLLGLVIAMLSARYLGPSNYGIINYASSIVAFVVPIMTLGLNNILVQELVDHPEREGEILGSSLLISFFSSLFCILGVISFSFIANAKEPVTIVVCALYSLMLIPQALELIQYWYQAKYLSKYTSIVALVAYVVISLYKIFLLACQKSIYWFAISNALDFFLIAISLLIIYRKVGGQKLSFSKKTAVQLVSKSKYYILSAMMVTVFAQTDKIMIKLMLGDEETGYYAAAVVCAGVCCFVFAAIIDSFRPTILECAKTNTVAFEKNMSLLYCIIIYLSLAQCLVMTIFAKQVVSILYGSAFFSAISALQIIVWYTTFSYLGSIRNIWILSVGKQKYLWIIDLCGAFLNVILNFILIPAMGINGAAVASLATQIFTNVIIGFILKPIRHNNRLMIRGLNPKLILELIEKRKRFDHSA